MILLPRYISSDNVRSLQKEQRKVLVWEKKDHQRMRVITDYRARDSCYAEARVQHLFRLTWRAASTLGLIDCHHFVAKCLQVSSQLRFLP